MEAPSTAEQTNGQPPRVSKTAYRNWTQLNDARIRAIRRMTADDPVAAEIFWFLVDHMSRQTNAISCSYKLLEKVTGKGRTTVYKALKYLREKQFIGVKKVGSSNIYHVNASVVWHSYGENLHYAELNAAILLDPEENSSLKVKEGRVNVVQQLELDM